jgi:hypothetical protein
MSIEGILSNTDLQFVFGANSVTLSPVTNAINLLGTTNARVSVNNVNNIELQSISATTNHISMNVASLTGSPVTSALVGSIFEIQAQTYTNVSASFITNYAFNTVAQNTLGSLVPTTFANASNFYVGPGPIAANTNMNIVNSYGLWVAGNLRVDGSTIGIATGAGGGSGVPGGTNNQIQFNANGAFGGTSGLTWSTATSILSASALSVTSNSTFNSISATSGVFGGLFATSSNLRTYQAVVATTGGDYNLVSSALAAGAKSIFVRAGTYNEPLPITISATTAISLIGESLNSTIINFGTQATGFNVSGVTKAVPGVINATSGSATITGTGTTFTNFVAGDYILLTEAFYQIASVVGVTTLTLNNAYQGPSFTSQAYIGSTMGNVTFSNMTINATTVCNVINLSSFINSTIQDVNIFGGSINLFQGSVNVDGIMINSSYSSTAALNITNVYESQFSNIVINNSASRGINFLDSKNFGVSNSNINNCLTEGIYIDFTLAQTNTSNITINNISSDNNASDGINLALNGRSINVNGSNFNYNRNYGIQCDARQCSIGNCVMFNNGLNSAINAGGIRTSGNYNNISNCYIRNSSGIAAAGISNGIDISGFYTNVSQTNIFGYSAGILIGNNNITVSNCSIDTNTILILIGATVSNTTVDANIFNTGTFGITVGSNSTSNNNIISANQFQSITSPIVIYSGANTLISGNNFITATTQITIGSLASNTNIINNIFPTTPGSTAVFDQGTGTSYFGNTIGATTYAVLSSGLIRITAPNPSTSGTTGAIQVTSGGIGVAGPSFFADTVDATNIISTTSIQPNTNGPSANLWNNSTVINEGYINVGTVANAYVTNWTTQVTPNRAFDSIVWSADLSLFVATTTSIGLGGIVTSPDGVTWTDRTAQGTVSPWVDVCWSPELGIFVAVRTTLNNTVQTSPDGITWTLRTSPAVTTTWNAVCWSAPLGLFCAVNGTGTVGSQAYTSPNGGSTVTTNWTPRQLTATAAIAYVDVCWSNYATGGSATTIGLFCAVSSSGAAATGASTSPDGITWTARNTSSGANVLSAVCWSDELGLFCAVSSTASTTSAYTSPTGVTWTARTTPSIAWNDVNWAPQLAIFIAVSNTASVNAMMTSPDGINWVTRTTPNKAYVNTSWSPSLNLFAITGSAATTTSIITNIIPTTGYNKLYNIGTDAASVSNVWGQVVNVGQRASRVNIGQYADQVFIQGMNFNYLLQSSIIAAARVTAAGVITYSYNIFTVVLSGTSLYTYTFSQSASNSNYYINAIGFSNNSGGGANTTRIITVSNVTLPSLTGFVLVSKDDAHALATSEHMVIVYHNGPIPVL